MLVEMVERRLIKLRCRYIHDDPAARQADNTIGVALRKMNLMQAAHDANAFALRDPAQKFQHADTGAWVEACNRFVRDDQTGPLRQRTRNRNTLLLTAGERVGALHGLRQHSDPLQTRKAARTRTNRCRVAHSETSVLDNKAPETA